MVVHAADGVGVPRELTYMMAFVAWIKSDRPRSGGANFCQRAGIAHRPAKLCAR